MPSPYAPETLWRDGNYRRLWFSLLISAFAGQIGALALSLTAAEVLRATPTQIGILGSMGTLPFVLFMLPAGVVLDRIRKLPAYLFGEVVMSLMFLCIPVAMVLDRLDMGLLYAVAFVGACVSVVSGTAGQIVLTQLVRRGELIEAHGRNRMAQAFAEIAGPGLAGMLIKLVGFPLAILLNCGLMLWSAVVLRGLRVDDQPAATRPAGFWPELLEGIRFVRHDRLLLTMALSVGGWQVFQTGAMVTQVLFATRELGLSAMAFGFCLAGAGVGTVVAGAWGHRLAARIGPGPSMIVGMAASGIGWLQLALAPGGGLGVVAFVVMLVCLGGSVVLIFSNLLALRQAVTPAPLLARMTSTMRWLTLFPAWPGALLGGVLAERFGLRFPLLVGGLGAILLAVLLWRFSPLRSVRQLGAAA
ncbi:MFS transporter [Sulfuritalea hydrogenivorans]|uniref:Major facilitator transporter n=1 Tax=Sulfuritalea hydrogenivorans sk43H TaxID=1223802 RepID=W0SD41_9PROT|nr:MFS transporter [Sulfuritalea hydrogenivorans]BAO28827.1 major facilitator transporter [Sulfuritalea hydrogenivorans sk43H]